MSSNIEPFGTSTDAADPDVAVIKAFGCTVIDFNVSADWSSQAGSLSFNIIEDEAAGDRLSIPVVGSPHLFELKDTSGNVLFQYVGLVESFSRSSNTGKKYSVSLTSPLTILNATKIILSGFLGLGGSLEGKADFSGLEIYNFGHRNSSIEIDNQAGENKWWNVSNLINVFAILENDDPYYRVPFQFDITGQPTQYGNYGFSAGSSDGIPLVKLMYAIHLGINHLPLMDQYQRQRTHGGNLLFGRHNYNTFSDQEGVPYYYHFDALGFYNQIKDKLGPQYRVAGQYKSLNEIISELCTEANLEYFCYIDIYTDTSIGDPTLQEDDPNWTQPAICSWQGLSINKFNTPGGKYGGTIRIQTVDKNSFINLNRPFSNIAYNLIGLEVPDLKDEYWTNISGIHPGKRPINNADYGLSSNQYYSDPLDSKGLDNESEGFTDVGTQSIASGGYFPVATTYWDSGKLNDIKINNSNISVKLNDLVTMKVVTGGYQTRLVSVPKKYLRHYWGDIILPNPTDPTEIEAETDSLGLNQTSLRKVPVVTTALDPEDIDDFIFIDMKDIFGDINISGVLRRGVYAASLYEIRIAMGAGPGDSFYKWVDFLKKFKSLKLKKLREYYYPNCVNINSWDSAQKKDITENGGAGYGACVSSLGLFLRAEFGPNEMVESKTSDGTPRNAPNEEDKSSNTNISCDLADANILKFILPAIHEKVKTIGDTHYGKSWYVPVPYFQTKLDLDNNNLVGNFDRSWNLTDSAYVEPSNYYSLMIPQSDQFISDGKVNPFINYDNNFILSSGAAGSGRFDEAYITKLESVIYGKSQEMFNFSEYNLDQLCITKYGNVSIIHAAPSDIELNYSFLPYSYETYYDRTKFPKYDLDRGLKTYYVELKTGDVGLTNDDNPSSKQNVSAGVENQPSENNPPTDNDYDGDSANPKKFPLYTCTELLTDVIDTICSFDYADNGKYSFAFIKCTTERVFLPEIKPTGLMGSNALYGFLHLQTGVSPQNGLPINSVRQNYLTKDELNSQMNPFPIAVAPKSVNYAQVSDRHVYGPWITSLQYIPFRGKIEYEQDESLVPENFLIPSNFGEFGGFTLSQTSGLTGLDLAAQGRANAIDDFALFAVEEGSITIPHAPAIKRIGDSLYGLPQVTDINTSMSNSQIETNYTFKTISPRFNKNNRDLEKNLSKISNKIKKFKIK